MYKVYLAQVSISMQRHAPKYYMRPSRQSYKLASHFLPVSFPIPPEVVLTGGPSMEELSISQ
jgi:hypothetical protein